ncbi:MAG: MarR family transcriptional regulator [Deltaproteobacteria bacterium]|nr:MarR family transcriptional regulator [Deltaproteobacteria bacterium]
MDTSMIMVDMSILARRERDPNAFIDKFGAVRRRVSALAAAAYAELDLGTTQAKFLRHVGDLPADAAISQAELARATQSDPALTGRTIETLVERGLVAREPSPTDRRAYVVSLTPAGRRTCERVRAMRTKFATRVVAALDERDLDDFDRIAGKLLAALDEPAS